MVLSEMIILSTPGWLKLSAGRCEIRCFGDSAFIRACSCKQSGMLLAIYPGKLGSTAPES